VVSRLRQPQKHLGEDEVARLVAKYRARSTIAELAAEFCCDRKTVMGHLKLKCVEMRYRRFTESQVDEIVRLRKSGMSVTEIGRSVGADPRTVRSRLEARDV
jgi:predicted transcriptional regulator